MQFKHAGLLQTVEDARHIQTTIVHLLGQTLHKDMEGLMTCGIEGVLEEETYNPLTEGLGTATPLPLHEFLRLRSVMVDEIQTEHKKVFRETHHLLLVEGEEIGIRHGIVVTGETLVIAEDTLLLEDIGRGHLLSDHISVVVAETLNLQCAVDQKIEMSTWISDMDDLSACGHLHETEARMACYNLQVVTAHALKQRELEQFIVYL